MLKLTHIKYYLLFFYFWHQQKTLNLQPKLIFKTEHITNLILQTK